MLKNEQMKREKAEISGTQIDMHKIKRVIVYSFTFKYTFTQGNKIILSLLLLCMRKRLRSIYGLLNLSTQKVNFTCSILHVYWSLILRLHCMNWYFS